MECPAARRFLASFQQQPRLVEQAQGVGALVDVHRQQLAELASAGEALAQAEDMPGDMVHGAAVLQVLGDVRAQPGQRFAAADHRGVAAEQLLVDFGQYIRVVVRLAAEHHAVEGLQVLLAFGERLDAAIEDELQVREVGLELRGNVIAQWRDLAVLLGREALEDGDARVYGEAAAACVAYLADEVAELGVTVAAVDADAVFDRDRDLHCVEHGLDTIAHQPRMAHQAGADHVVLHAVAGAADVEVHFVVAGVLREYGAGGQVRRHAATQLQGQRVLGFVMAQKTLGVAMQQGAGGDHFGVEQGIARQQAQEEAAVAVGPVHHGCYRKPPDDRIAWGCWVFRLNLLHFCISN